MNPLRDGLSVFVIHNRLFGFRGDRRQSDHEKDPETLSGTDVAGV